MNLDLSGKRAIVCGSTDGIGKAAAIELALLGADITLLARNEEKLRSTLKELKAAPSQKHGFLVADFTKPDDVEHVVQTFVAANTVHILVNNTGGPPGGLAIDAKAADFVAAFSSHLLCNQILAQAVVAGMKRERYGRIVNVISTSVKIPIKGLGVSNTIRGAVASWSKTLSNELGQFGITVNNVLPGSTMTGRLESLLKANATKAGKTIDEVREELIAEIPAKRIAEANEVGAAIAFLATPAAGYINGINVPVDGGRTGSL